MAARKEVNIYVFGDQTYDSAEALRSLGQTHNDPLLADFIERSCAVLKREVAQLRSAQQSRCPRFARIVDLVSHSRAGALNPCLSQALTCIAQLGLFIRRHSSGCQVYPTPEQSCLAGVCTGALAAAAVSCAHSVSSLVDLALHAVAVAVRLGALAWDVSSRIDNNDDENSEGSTSEFAAWSYAVAGSSPEALADALKQYAAETMLPTISVPYISAVVGPTQTTISGRPDIVTDFLASPMGKGVAPTCTVLPIVAPYHSALLYSERVIDQVLSVLPKGNLPCGRIPVISTSADTKDAISRSSTFRHLLEEAVRDCLQRQMALDQLPERLAQHVKHASKSVSGMKTEVVIQPIAFKGTERLGPPLRGQLPTDLYLVREASSHHSIEHTAFDSALGANGGLSKPPIAILAASGRFPGRADTMDAFWDILIRGVDTHEMVPSSRWNSSTHVGDTGKKNVSGAGFGCWLHQASQFDITFFNMSPREASQVDPAQRLALLTTAEALEQAGIVPDRTPSTQKHRVGVWFGSTSNDWMETNSAQNIDTYFIPGGNRAFIPGRINYHFKFRGPSYTIDTACSSSLAALHLACNALWGGEVDTAIVGGTNILTNPDMTAGLDRGHFLSRTGNCKTFDDSADGYCRGEAVVTIVLKRLDDAVADKDPIQACIRGIATNHNAEAESITRPHSEAQVELFEHLLAEANISPVDISYVEMHGTGTQVGDAAETTSVVTTLSPLTARGSCVRPATHPLHIGAVKSNVGHGEAAAGVTSLAKVLMMMKHSALPPHAGIKTKVNHRLPDLPSRNTHIAMEPTEWPRPRNGKRRVLLNNFSAAGGNTAMILEDAPAAPRRVETRDPRRHHIVAVSAKTPDSLISNLRNMIQWLDGPAPHRDTNLLPKLSYTTTSRRIHHRHRVAIPAPSLDQLRSSLQRYLGWRTGDKKSVPVSSQGAGIVFTFTGQGSTQAGMGADLYKRFTAFRTDVQHYDHLCIQMGMPSILPVFEQGSSFGNASPTLLQLAHVCYQMALCRLWQSFGVRPRTVVGHSLGEYAAMYAAGMLSQADVIYLVGSRAKLMEEHLSAGSYTMLIVLAPEASVLAALPESAKKDLEVCCRNGEHNVVLGGKTARMLEIRALIESKDMRCHVLDTPFGFHTSQVDPILVPFFELSSKVRVRDPVVPVISPTVGEVLRKSSEFGDGYFVRHCRDTVNIQESLNIAKSEGLINDKSIAVEIGPAPVVCRMVKDVVGPQMQVFASMHKRVDTWQLLAEAMAGMYMAGVNVEWEKYHQDFPECHEALQLPAYGWTLKEYWMQYVHDWSLRKGDPASVMGPARFPHSSIYRVVEDTLRGSADGRVVVDIDLNSKDVHSMAQGHKVYGVPLCTPSVYADISLMIGKHVTQVTGMAVDEMVTEIAEMHIQSALVANDVGKKQILRTDAKFDKESRAVFCTFSSVDSKDRVIEQHAECKIRFCPAEAVKSDAAIKAASSDALTRSKALDAQVGEAGNTFRFSKAMVYKMVTQLADFDPKYRGLSAVTLNNDTLEAAGVVSFKGLPDNDTWFSNPGCLDAISQLGGFVMNANEGVDLEKEIFINHGWESMKLLTPKLDPNMTYHSYVKMTEGEDKMWMGDVIVFDESHNLVGFVGGVTLQGVPKRLMQYIVNSASTKVSGRGISFANESALMQPVSLSPTLERHADVALTAAIDAASRPAADTQNGSANTWEVALTILSEESGIDKRALAEDVALAALGIDSLLSLVICGRIRDELDMDLPERALFVECTTVGDVKLRICGPELASPVSLPTTLTGSDSASVDSESPVLVERPSPILDMETEDACPTPASTLDQESIHDLEKNVIKLKAAPIPPAWSMYLQGSRKRSTQTLFLFPDGCGAATSYLALPDVAPTTALVAFNSPFIKTPSRMYDHNLQEVLNSYLAGLRSRQEKGPYHLGGWSAGGILAFAVVSQLIAEGEKVASLTLIDSPPPNNGLDCLPDRFYEHCTRVGIFANEMRRGADDAPPPDWLMPHFRASTQLFNDYHAPPLPPSGAEGLQVNIIWAGECAFDGIRYPTIPPPKEGEVDVEGMKFLTERRKDFGPGKWAELFPGANITSGVVWGEHHFSMMRGEGAERLVELVRDGLSRASSA
ncbi:beta-ketoacyl synthase domain-containing protein [Colletotrichum caudatum]|nr:beta-ketoacyl synthase domain-containing protein [Colletotrichum caudatum]